MLFKVKKKFANIAFTVYDVSCEEGKVKFLIYKDNAWRWVEANHYIPIEEDIDSVE